MSWEVDELRFKELLPKLLMKCEVGAEMLLRVVVSLAALFGTTNFEFSSSMRVVNSSILSFKDEICSERCIITPYRRSTVIFPT